MRKLTQLLTAAVILAVAGSLVACGGSEKKKTTTKKKEAPAFPKDYASWHKVNAETIIREDEDEEGGGAAHELYANMVGMLEAGTVLVKEKYGLADGAPAQLDEVHIMRMTDGAENDGWQFLAFDPTGNALPAEATEGCVGCHSLQKENAYLFSDIEALKAPAAAEADGESDGATEGDGAAEGDGTAEGDGSGGE